jgi:hypothetical protein
MFQEKNVKSLYKIKNVYIFQWLKKMLIYDIYIFIVFMTLKVVIFDILSLLMVFMTIPIMKLFSVLKFYFTCFKTTFPTILQIL